MSENGFLATWNISAMIAMILVVALAVACFGSGQQEVDTPEPAVEMIANEEIDTPEPVAEDIADNATVIPVSSTRFEPGTYAVGKDIKPGIYAGKGGERFLDSCYWARRGDMSGGMVGIISSGNARGQYYVEVMESDMHLETGCVITHISEWPLPDAPLAAIEQGTYLVGRDIRPGTYSGEASTRSSCYWERLSGISGKHRDVLENGMSVEQYTVKVHDSDYALETSCRLEYIE